MTTIIVDTRPIGFGAHEVQTLTPVRSGDFRKVSALCACGWRTVGVAHELDEAAAIARGRAEEHVEEAFDAEATVVVDRAVQAAALADLVVLPATEPVVAGRRGWSRMKSLVGR